MAALFTGHFHRAPRGEYCGLLLRHIEGYLPLAPRARPGSAGQSALTLALVSTQGRLWLWLPDSATVPSPYRYLINFLLDATVGMLLIYLGVRAVSVLVEWQQWESLRFGEYGNVPWTLAGHGGNS